MDCALNLQSCRRNGAGNLEDFPVVETLDLSHSLPDDNAIDVMKSVGKLKSLRTLRLGNEATQFEYLYGGHNHCRAVTPAGFRELRNLNKLQTLELYRCLGLTRAHLAEIASLENLTTLSLSGCRVKSEDLKQLVKLKKLNPLNLSGDGITDGSMTDEDIRVVATFSNLTTLDIRNNTLITDVGLKELTKLKKLTLLHLPSRLKGSKGVAELPKMLPNCEITYLFSAKSDSLWEKE